jgi:hypothetical protein
MSDNQDENLARVLNALQTSAMSIPDCIKVFQSRSASDYIDSAIEAVDTYEAAINDGKMLLSIHPDPASYRQLAIRVQRHALFFGNLGVLRMVDQVCDIQEGSAKEVLLFSQFIQEMTRARDAVAIISQFCMLAGRDVCGRPLKD